MSKLYLPFSMYLEPGWCLNTEITSSIIVWILYFSVSIIDLKVALGKKRRDGKTAPLRSLTTIQRVHIGRLIDKYGDDYQVRVFLCFWWFVDITRYFPLTMLRKLQGEVLFPGNVQGYKAECNAALSSHPEEALPKVSCTGKVLCEFEVTDHRLRE